MAENLDYEEEEEENLKRRHKNGPEKPPGKRTEKPPGKGIEKTPGESDTQGQR